MRDSCQRCGTIRDGSGGKRWWVKGWTQECATGVCRSDELEGGRENSDECPRSRGVACADKEEHLKFEQELQEEKGVPQER